MKKLILILLLLYCAQAKAENRKFQVRTADNLTLSAQEWGDAGGPEIVLIHGLGQSHLSWERQYEGALAKGFRILTYDLRGHRRHFAPNNRRPLSAHLLPARRQ